MHRICGASAFGDQELGYWVEGFTGRGRAGADRV